MTKCDKVQRGFKIVDFSVTSFLVMAPNIFITHQLLIICGNVIMIWKNIVEQ